LAPLALFRCDASPAIGAGHVTRCLALAEALVEADWSVSFAVEHETVATVPTIATGCDLQELDGEPKDEPASLRRQFPDGVDLLVVDHYGRDVSFERACRGWARRILVMDDGTGRQHDCDLLVDAAASEQAIYAGCVPATTRMLLGPPHALIRQAFVTRRESALQRRDGRAVNEILLSFGAADPQNANAVALEALDCFVDDISVIVAMSSLSPQVKEVRRRLRGRAQLALDADMAQLMTEADLAVGAAGVSAFERAALGLPSILVTLADNQRGVAEILTGVGAAVDGGKLGRDFAPRLRRLARELVDDPAARIRIAEAANQFVDGRGAQRLLLAVVGEARVSDGSFVRLRLAEANDERRLLELQHESQMRKYFRNPAIPNATEHARWMRRMLSDKDAVLAIIELNGQNAGMLRLDRQGRQGLAHYATSIAVSAPLRGRGVASAALSLIRRMKPMAIFEAHIMPENTASTQLFLRAGFVREDGDHYLSRPGTCGSLVQALEQGDARSGYSGRKL
jgi:UDP-2,4-diacetamido-2,4,6-trideoxy-beta-L-altropyranose hydrolase